MLTTEQTSFSRDVLGRYVCNTMGEALRTHFSTERLDAKPFDIVVIGAGTSGAAIAEQIFKTDQPTKRHRILVLQDGRLSLPEHIQNLPPLHAALGPPSACHLAALKLGQCGQSNPGSDPLPPRNETWGLPWHSPTKFPGIAYTLGGRSLYWGGWSPPFIDTELPLDRWPHDVVSDLQATYLNEAAQQIGTDQTNDFISGALHDALRQQLFDGVTGTPPADVLIPAGADGLEAPLAVQSAAARQTSLPLNAFSPARPGFFPTNKFSTAPLLIAAARKAFADANAREPDINFTDFYKRLMIVPDCHVNRIDLVDGRPWVRTNRGDVGLPLHGIVVVATGTIESTRLALNSLPDPHGNIGKNLMAHLRSNLTIRIPREAVAGLVHDPSQPGYVRDLQASALFVKGRHVFSDDPAIQGHFHLQITASGLGAMGSDSEVEMFKTIPDLDDLQRLAANADDSHVVITIRGIGEMQPMNPASRVVRDPNLDADEHGAVRALVTVAPSDRDSELWRAMDQASDQVAKVFANGQSFTVFTPQGEKSADSSSNLEQLLKYEPSEHPDPQMKGRRDGLGTTHHESGTLWMGDDATASVTNSYGRFHNASHVFAVGPALLPTIGSPNPMLSGIALVRRTAQHIIDESTPVAEAGFDLLFDGSNLDGWQMAGPGRFIPSGGGLISEGGMGLLWYSQQTFRDFVLRLQWRASRVEDNSGVFVRFPNPGLDPWVAVNQGYEIQIDDRGFNPETGAFGSPPHQTGAIYSFSPSSHVASRPVGTWNDLEIRAQAQTYAVTLNGSAVVANFTGNRQFEGFIGLQNHGGPSQVVFRNIRIQEL